MGKFKYRHYSTIFLLHGFWPNTINSIVPGGWSIADEVIFYILFPYLVMIMHNKYLNYLLLAIAVFFFYHIILLSHFILLVHFILLFHYILLFHCLMNNIQFGTDDPVNG